MLKKIMAILLSAIILLLNFSPVVAQENVRGIFFLKNIVINGETIVNYNLQYPFFIYGDTTYIPLTQDMGDICGFDAEMDWENSTLKFEKKEPILRNIRDNRYKTNAEDVYGTSDGNISVVAQTGEKEQAVVLASKDDKQVNIYKDEIKKAKSEKDNLASEEAIDLKVTSVIIKDSIVYMPIRVLASHGNFNWDIAYDPYFGISISTIKGVSANTYLSEAVRNYNAGLVDYIKGRNKNKSTSTVQDMVFMFHRAAEVYNIDEKLLIAIAEKESTFKRSARSHAGAIGLMQIMPRTAAGMGVQAHQLYDLKVSIDFGAMYISDKITRYDGDVVKALSAYNAGPGAVSRGAYSRGYADKVINTKGQLENYLVNNGYGLGQ